MPGAEPKRKLRVLTLIDFLAPEGGGERVAADIAMGLDPERFERTYCATRWPYEAGNEPGDDRAIAELEGAGVEVLGLGRTSKLNLRSWGPLMKVFRERPIDVVHAHKFGSNLWGSILGTRAKVPVIVSHEHTWSFEGNRPRVMLDRHVVGRLSDAVVAVSAADRERMIEIEGMDPEKVVLIPNGIADPRPPSGADVRASLGIRPDAPVAVAIGHLRAQKAYGVLIEAAATLRDELPGLRVLIVGEGSMRDELERLISERGVGDAVTLLGHRDDVGDLIAASDIGVSSSDFEGGPIAMLELMAAGKPIVATAVGGVPDLVADGDTGLLVPPGDPGALAAAMGEILGDPATAARMGEAGRARQQAEFSLRSTVDRVSDLYEELFLRATTNAPAVARSASSSAA